MRRGFLFAAALLLILCMGQTAYAAKVKSPTGLKADYDKNYVKLTWKKVSKAKGYVVYRYSSTAGQYIRLGATKKNSYSMSGLSAGTLYRFKVRAYRRTKSRIYYSKYSTKINHFQSIPFVFVHKKLSLNLCREHKSWDTSILCKQKSRRAYQSHSGRRDGLLRNHSAVQ